jgi:uncharacterized RDD family membrane protein YckC
MPPAPLSAPSATPPVANPVAPAPASLGRRAGALIYEWLLLTALLFVATFALLPLVSPEPAAVAPSARTLQLPSVPARAFTFLALFAVGALYFVASWTGGRRTLAMKTWRLRLVGPDGAPPDRQRALLRYLAGWIGPALAVAAYLVLRPFGLSAHVVWLVAFNWLWALIDRDRRFLHDRIAGTRLLYDAAGA